MEKRQSD